MQKGSIIRRVFDFVSNGELRWRDMGAVYDQYRIGQETYDVVAGKARFVQEFVKNFPSESEAVDLYLKKVKRVNRWTQSVFVFDKLLPARMAMLVRPLISLMRPAYANETCASVLQSVTDDRELASALVGQWGGCGTPPARMSFLMHAGAVAHYLNGGYYPEGGPSQIARTVIPVIEQAAGQVFVGAPVGCEIGFGVSPFPKRGLDEALGLTIGLGVYGLVRTCSMPTSRHASRKAKAL